MNALHVMDSPERSVTSEYIPAVVAWIVSALLSHSVDGTFWRSVVRIPLGDEIIPAMTCSMLYGPISPTDVGYMYV